MNGFFIWFEQRSGSSYLVSLLNSHPEIDCRGEMFGARRQQRSNTTREFRENAYQRTLNLFPGHIANPSDEQTVQHLSSWLEPVNAPQEIHGFKFKHPSQHGLYPEITDKLLHNADSLRLIVLQRKNYLRRAISLINMQRIQSMQSTANTKSELNLPPLAVDTKEVIRLVKYYAQSQNAFDQFTKHFPARLELDFEQLCTSPEIQANRLQDFLGVKNVQALSAQLKRITPKNLADAISNFDEFKKEIESSGLAEYLR